MTVNNQIKVIPKQEFEYRSQFMRNPKIIEYVNFILENKDEIGFNSDSFLDFELAYEKSNIADLNIVLDRKEDQLYFPYGDTSEPMVRIFESLLANKISAIQLLYADCSTKIITLKKETESYLDLDTGNLHIEFKKEEKPGLIEIMRDDIENIMKDFWKSEINDRSLYLATELNKLGYSKER